MALVDLIERRAKLPGDRQHQSNVLLTAALVLEAYGFSAK
jgi:hypothetical protein